MIFCRVLLMRALHAEYANSFPCKVISVKCKLHVWMLYSCNTGGSSVYWGCGR